MKFSLRPLILAFSLACAASQANATGRLADVNVYNRDSGQQLTVYPYRGQYYVVGTPGNRYAVNVRNTRGERLMTVVSVDGVNVVNGETASPNQTGYVLDGYGTTEITGWRKNMNEVATFVFAKEANSYAARTGRPDNVGVIGVAVFREKIEPRPYDNGRIAPGSSGEYDRKSSAAQAPGATTNNSPQGDSRPAPDQRLGTAHGKRESSEVNYTDFVRASSRPDEVISLRYDSYRNLVAQGVIRAPRNGRQQDPNPFPGQFVPDPR